MEINIDIVKLLREKSNFPLQICKEALELCNGNKERAAEWLRVRGLAIIIRSPNSYEELREEAIKNGFNLEVLKKPSKQDLIWLKSISRIK